MSLRTYLSTAAMVAISLLSTPAAQASWTGGPQLCGSCGPTSTAEFFIVGDTGAGPFESPGLSTLPGGWTASLVNAHYVIASGPTTNLTGWTEHYLGNIADSVEIDMFFWTGAPLVSSISLEADFTRSVNGAMTSVACQSFGTDCAAMNDPTGVNYDRSAASIPEPGGLALFGIAMVGLIGMRRRQK